VKDKYKVLSLNSQIGAHLISYQKNGGTIGLGCELKETAKTNLTANLPIPTEAIDPRWFYNRKDKGTEDLLSRLDLKKVGSLDVLDITTLQTKETQNLFDTFGIARRLQPKIVIAYAPASTLQNNNIQKFNSFLDYLRYDNLRHPDKRKYFVSSVLINSRQQGSCVSKTLTLIVGIREDIARPIGIKSDQAIRYLLPKIKSSKSLRKCLDKIDVSNEEQEFWFRRTALDERLSRVIQHLPKDPHLEEYFKGSPRLLADLGFSKNSNPKIVRSSFDRHIPDPSKFSVIHPSSNRLLSLTELKSIYGLPKKWKSTCNDIEMIKLVTNSVPVELANSIVKSVVVRVLEGDMVIKDSLDPVLQKIALVDSIADPTDKNKSFVLETDFGTDFSYSLISKTPSLDDFDYLFDADEINQDFAVYGYDPDTGRRIVIGAIQRKVFTDTDRLRCIKAIKRVKEKTDARITCAPPVPQERLNNYEKQGRKYQVSDDGKSYRLWLTSGHWDRWRGHPIPSATYGWLRDKNTKQPTLNSEFRKNRQSKEDFEFLNNKAEKTYLKLAKDDFNKQARFIRSRIPKQCRLGGTIFTTLAINRYGNEMSAMDYHIDSGDENSGLTTISVFDEGTYKGGYFVSPRYRCAFKVGDGDVFVANSREVHGVTQLEGAGKRLSVVSYTKTNLGYRQHIAKAYPPKSPRPKFRIDQYQIAIPSYRRHKTIVGKTLGMLERHNIDPKRVTIFVGDESERKKYEKALVDSPYKKIVVAVTGIMEVRNFMWEYYQEGTPVLFIDDDVTDIQVVDTSQSLKSVTDLYRDVISVGFNSMRENHAYLWGCYGVSNAGFMTGLISQEDDDETIKERISVGNWFIAGVFFGAIIRHDPKLLVHNADKEDYERSVLHFIKDGRVVRMDFMTADAIIYKGEGGLVDQRTKESSHISSEYMLKKYPKYVRDMGVRDKGQHAGVREIRLV
jgi:site-specific DNA-cytosine methylase